MKHIYYLKFCFCLFMVGFTMTSYSQSIEEFFNKTNVNTTWLGLDFSETRLYGDPKTDPNEIKDYFFGSINNLVNTEPEKYDISATFRKTKLTIDLSHVRKSNSNLDADKIKTTVSKDMNRMDNDMINRIVKSYDFEGKKGYGILFVVEGLNKVQKKATMYVTILDMESKNILMARRMQSPSTGFGFRNYWASTFYRILKEIKKDSYDDWKEGKNK